VVYSGNDGSAVEVFTAVAYPATVPTITSISPASAPSTGGTTVVIKGTGFLSMTGAAAVKFDGLNATSYTVNSSTQITAVTPAHAVGQVNVTVTAAGGTSSTAGTADDFYYLTRYQQDDPHLVYTGIWIVSHTGSPSGGSFVYTTQGGSVTINFTGKYLAWIAKKYIWYGIASVKVDSKPAVMVDLYSPTEDFQRTVWSTGPLEYGAHTVKIDFTDTKRDPADGTYINVDAFDIWGTFTQVPTVNRYEQEDPRLLYSGTWTKSTAASASGGSFRFANTAGSSVLIPFSGTSFSWIAKKSPVYGKAKLTLDGKTTTTVDLYDASTLYKRTAWSSGKLSAGLHWAKIQWTGTKNTAATDTNIGLDAVDVLGTLAAPTRFEQGNEKIDWLGGWTTVNTPSASGSSFRYADTAGASATIDFTGISLNLIAKKSPVYGKAEIKLDDRPAVTVDLYASAEVWKQTVWKSGFLLPGDHKVVIKWTGTKRTAATDYNINVDAVDVIGALK
jgi:hypothetical protein